MIVVTNANDSPAEITAQWARLRFQREGGPAPHHKRKGVAARKRRVESARRAAA